MRSQFFSSRRGARARASTRPAALPVEADGQTAVALLLEELVRAGVPDLDRARAVLALGDLALEAGVVERMVLDVHGEVPLARLERHALRHRPGEEDAVALEPEVVVEAARIMALDDEDRPSPPSASRKAPESFFLSRLRS
jgi:hypothetical protein